MRTLVDIPDADVAALDELARRRRESRAKVLRAAIGEYLTKHRTMDTSQAFGLWGSDAEDGVEYQRRLRAEW
jgi:metal-responsive CopG/Arc/MetJ family transcriptional regulator